MDDIRKKILLLESLLNKAEANLSYAVLVEFGQDKETAITEMRQNINSAKLLFINGRIESLDLDPVEREKATHDWHRNLDYYLQKFPEFKQSLKNESPKL